MSTSDEDGNFEEDSSQQPIKLQLDLSFSTLEELALALESVAKEIRLHEDIFNGSLELVVSNEIATLN